MGILDDAIREHLELKRRHGATDDELERQEEEALGPARRDVAPADADGDEAVKTAPAEAAEEPQAEGDDLHAAETALHEPEPAESAPEAAPGGSAELAWSESGMAEAASEEAAQEASGLEPAEREAWPETQPSEPLHETQPSEAPESGVGQPTQPFDVQTDEPWPEPPAEPQPEATEALPAEPAGDETVLEPKADHPTADPVLDPDPPARSGDTPARGFDALPENDEDEPFAEEPEDEPSAEEPRDEPEPSSDDVLEDTPDFLEETPEHDRLWFEQKPPRDFDFD